MVPAKYALIILLTIAPGLLQSVHACGLEPAFEDGLKVSYPGALDVAVAVADARRSGLLPQASSAVASSQASLHQMLADLSRLQSRLDRDGAVKTNASFSIVLVGPGLWSRYYLTSRGAIAQYHTRGPRTDEVVVMLHHSVLQALLEGALTTGVAEERGLLVFSGEGATPVKDAFDASFLESTSSLALANFMRGE